MDSASADGSIMSDLTPDSTARINSLKSRRDSLAKATRLAQLEHQQRKKEEREIQEALTQLEDSESRGQNE